jgi:hypothetical protein
LDYLCARWDKLEIDDAAPALGDPSARTTLGFSLVLAYNLGNFLRTLATPEPIKIPWGGR